MNDDTCGPTGYFFLDSGSTQLEKIYLWARARYAAPWAVFFAVLLRVAASVGPHVQLPGTIGGRASLNLLCAFVSPSGGGKGISGKVARLAWPTPIPELPIGSGEGIAETFKKPAKPDADNEPPTAVIFDVPEIDTLAGIASRQGSILLAQLKSMAMGEQLGQTNASKATTRIAEAHTYRCCLSVGAQPGHTGVLFGDTTGGTPQRFLWAMTIDPSMPATPIRDPAPLDTAIPSWSRDPDGVVEIQYGPAEIKKSIIEAHLARQRGEANALDGHRMLTRCKVAAVLAIMHGRSVVSEWDWQRSAEVMDVSDSTREWIVTEAAKASRAKVRERAIGRATFDEIIDERHGATVRNRIVRLLSNGPMSRSELRRAMGKQHYREAFDAVLPQLEKISQVLAIAGEKAPHYMLNPEFTGEPEFTPRNASSDGVNQEFTGEPPSNVTAIDSRRPHDMGAPKLSCQKWMDNHIDTLRRDGTTTIESFAVYSVGEAQGYKIAALRTAASNNKYVTTIDRTSRGSTWDITGESKAPHRPAREWVTKYLDRLPADTTVIDKDAFEIAAKAAGYTWTTARHAAINHPRIESVQGGGKETAWVISPAGDPDDSEESTA